MAVETDGSGFVFQNFIFNILKTNILFSGAKINYWRTKEKAEVDFILSLGDKIVPVEVKYANFKKPEINRSLKSFIEKYNPKKAFIVNKSLKDSLIIGKTEVNFVPFGKLSAKMFLGKFKTNVKREWRQKAILYLPFVVSARGFVIIIINE